MTTPLHLDIQMTGILDTAIDIWRKDGGVMTCSFALGNSASAFAQPFETAGTEVTFETRIALHALIASAVDARYIGRVDETWTRLSEAGDPELLHGDLERMADQDPQVATALCVQAYDLETGSSYLQMATLALREDGSQRWSRTYSEDFEGRLVGGSAMTARVIPIISDDLDLTADVVEGFLNAVGWTMTIGSVES